MGRILGVDYGRARVGLALSDPLGTFAQPLEVVSARTNDERIAAVTRVAEERDADLIVIGLPLQMDGNEGQSAAEVRAFGAKLAEAAHIPITFWDERLSTARAEREMLDADMSRAGRKKRRDMIAAQIFLQSYLDAHRG